MTEAASILPDDIAELKAMVLSMQASLRAHEVLTQSLRIQIARLKKQKFGASSEKVEREIPLGTLLRNTLPGSGAVGTGA